MSKKKAAAGLPSRQDILQFIADNPGKVGKREIAKAFGLGFAATVTEISPTAEFTPKAVETREERVNLVYAAKVDLDDGWTTPLVPGQPAKVLVATTAAPESHR